MKLPGWIITILTSILMAAVLELNKSTLLGWLLFAVALAVMITVSRKYMGARKWWKKGLCIPAYLAVCVCIVFISWPPIRQVPAADTADPQKTGVYSTEYGDVRGVVLGSGVELFAGIPYAAPPVGDLRWKKPQDPEPWQSVLECDTFAPMSMQSQNLPIYNSLAQIIGYHDYQISLKDNYREAFSEDSLYLNIWKPAGTVEKAPVAVYIHGGSLKTGQPWYRDYSGEGYAKDGVICVNMGYRLGVFGFLATDEMMEEEGTAGNFGLLDQIKALEWVRQNIENFGGDPDNITLIGESAGAVCVDALCVSPLASGRLGSWHSGEMVYTFGMIPEGSKLYTEEDRQLSDTMHSFWVNFVRNGDPNSGELTGFEQSADTAEVMEFGVNTGMVKEPDLAFYGILDRMYGWK